MFARVDTVIGSSSRLDQARGVAESSVEGFVGAHGFAGCFLLLDPKAGKALWITLWETEEDLIQGAWGMSAIRDRLVAAMGGSAGPTERFEVPVHAP